MNENQFNESLFLGTVQPQAKAPENFSPILYDGDMVFKQFLSVGDFLKVEDETALKHQYIFNIEYKDTSTIAYGDYIAYPDIDMDWQLYKVVSPSYKFATYGDTFTALCEHIMYDLIKNRPINTSMDTTLEDAIDTCLSNTQFIARFSDTSLRTLPVAREIEYRNPLDAIDFICSYNNINCEFKPKVSIYENGIASLILDFHIQLGKDQGVEFEKGYNLDSAEIQLNDESLITALDGTGTDDDGNIIDISTIEWTTPTYPCNKPLGQTYIEDTEATALYGTPILSGGSSKSPLFNYYQSQSKTPLALIWEMWDQIRKNKEPLINYPLSLSLLESVYANQKVRLGDTVHLKLNDELTDEVVFRGNVRVIRVTRDRLGYGEDKIELGNVITTFLDQTSILKRKTRSLSTDSKIPASALGTKANGSMIANNTLDYYHLKVGSIKAELIDVNNLAAISAILGQVKIGGSGNGNGILELYDSSDVLKVLMTSNGITLSDNTEIIGGNGVLSVLQTVTNWQWIGTNYQYPLGGKPTITIDIPPNFIILSATLESFVKYKHMYGFSGHTDGWYAPVGMSIYQTTNPYDMYIDWGYATEYYDVNGGGGSTNRTTALWGGTWSPAFSAARVNCAVKSADVASFLTVGAKTTFSIQSSELFPMDDWYKGSDFKMILTVKGYQK